MALTDSASSGGRPRRHWEKITVIHNACQRSASICKLWWRSQQSRVLACLFQDDIRKKQGEKVPIMQESALYFWLDISGRWKTKPVFSELHLSVLGSLISSSCTFNNTFNTKLHRKNFICYAKYQVTWDVNERMVLNN